MPAAPKQHIHGAPAPRTAVLRAPTVIGVSLPLEEDEARTTRLEDEGRISLELLGRGPIDMTAREAISLARGLEEAADKLINHLPKDGGPWTPQT